MMRAVCFYIPIIASPDKIRGRFLDPYFFLQAPKQAAAAIAAGDMSEMEREFMRAPDDSSEESDDDEEALNQCSDDDSKLAPEDF